MSEGVESQDDKDSCTIYRFSRKDVDAVNVASWYEKFKEISPKTVLLPLPPEVLKYLKSDGMVMPQNTHTTAHLNIAKRNEGGAAGRSAGSKKDEGAEEEDDDNGSWASFSDTDIAPNFPSRFLQKIAREQRAIGLRGASRDVEEEEEEEFQEEEELEVQQSESSDSSENEEEEEEETGLWMKEVEKFHEFDSLLDAGIKELGGAVMPKINRKSPKDATWIAFNRSLKCYNPGDIYLLLKTSDVVSYLLEDPYRECPDLVTDDQGASGTSVVSASTTCTSPYMLVLKQWNDSWGPEMEFRCFICANQLLAICQRDLDTCYSAIVKRKDKLLLNIQNFFLRNIHGRFSVDFYVMDIVCHPNGEIYVVDFDVFGLCTDPLLFTYQELQSIYQDTMGGSSSVDKDDNRLRESPTNGHQSHSTVGQPCLRFLTESRNFRARKSTGRTALANDVMTYIRESVSRN